MFIAVFCLVLLVSFALSTGVMGYQAELLFIEKTRKFLDQARELSVERKLLSPTVAEKTQAFAGNIR